MGPGDRRPRSWCAHWKRVGTALLRIWLRLSGVLQLRLRLPGLLQLRLPPGLLQLRLLRTAALLPPLLRSAVLPALVAVALQRLITSHVGLWLGATKAPAI